jgi:hypothetical protein
VDPAPRSSSSAKSASIPKLRIEDILGPETVPSLPDRQTKNEQEDLNRTEKKLRNEDLSQNILARKRTARCLFWMVAVWLLLDMVVMFLQGFNGFSCYPFHLESKVLITLITSTTASVLGLFGIVTRYLFPSSKR